MERIDRSLEFDPARLEAALLPEEIKRERWLPIAGWPGYEVSDMGRVRSFRKGGPSKILKSTPRILAIRISSHGYIYTQLCDGAGKMFSIGVHRLVLLTFKPEEATEDMEVNHKDLQPTNNRLGNLEWLTHSNNMHHYYERDRERKAKEEKVETS